MYATVHIVITPLRQILKIKLPITVIEDKRSKRLFNSINVFSIKKTSLLSSDMSFFNCRFLKMESVKLIELYSVYPLNKAGGTINP